MIQRIQTLWLVLAAVCMALCYAMPVAEYEYELGSGQKVTARLDLVGRDNPEMMQQLANMEPEVAYSQRVTGMPTWPMVALSIACIALAVACVLLYHNRVLQMRMAAVGFLFSVVYVFIVFFWAVDHYKELLAPHMAGAEPSITWHVGSYAPIAAMAFFFLAQRAIRRDEARVRAADRLR